LPRKSPKDIALWGAHYERRKAPEVRSTSAAAIYQTVVAY
jgi:hypothetical protein